MRGEGWTRRTALWMAILFVLAALALRCSTFGNPGLGVDEQFYLLVGKFMHQGVLPYVDVWDRKPLGLFLLYGLFASLPNPVIGFQIAASLFAAANAWVIARILTACMTGPAARQGALLGGLAYLLCWAVRWLWRAGSGVLQPVCRSRRRAGLA
jgi:hypothetical protein